MLDAVVVIVHLIDVVHVVVVDVGPLQGLAAAKVLLSAKSVLIHAWLVFLGVDWHLGRGATKWSDLRGN